MATEKTYQLLAIARRRLFVNEIVTWRRKFELTKRIIKLARRARRENLTELNAFVDIGVDQEDNDPKAVYARVEKEIFGDGVILWGRIVAFFAWTIYFQSRFNIEMEKEVSDFSKSFFPIGWLITICPLVGTSSEFLQTQLSFCFHKTVSCRVLFSKIIILKRHVDKDRRILYTDGQFHRIR